MSRAARAWDRPGRSLGWASVGYLRAIALDYDGTLAGDLRPDESVLEAVREVRSAGSRVVLVTGRILSELREVFPDVDDHFDALVAENGAVLCEGGAERALTAPVPVALDEGLVRRGIPFRRGRVLLACDGAHDVVLLAELRRIGADCQLIRNRGALMVLPAGVTKGSGLSEALAHLGVSRHSAVAVGDAENDAALLEACELGVAVANAIPALQERADLVLDEANGMGVERFLRGSLLRDELRLEPRRWRIELGAAPDGEPVTLPASQVNLLVTGGSGSGKSYATGLLFERLLGLGYSACILDPEGDHAALGRLHGCMLVGGREGLPGPGQVCRILQHRLGSAVVDLSFAGAERDAYVGELIEVLERMRADTGLPHWIFVDEAHEPFGAGRLACASFVPESRGYCLVTWRPRELCETAKGCFDYLLVLAGEHGIERDALRMALELTGIPRAPEAAKDLELGQGLLVRMQGEPALQVFTLPSRTVEHVRHWHKYAGGELPPERRFYFRDDGDSTGAVAANLEQFHHEVRRCTLDVLRHHAAGGDFSRWIRDVVKDGGLAAASASVERGIQRSGGAQDVEALRRELIELIEERYTG